MKKILEEQQLSLSGIVSSETASKMGELCRFPAGMSRLMIFPKKSSYYACYYGCLIHNMQNKIRLKFYKSAIPFYFKS
jgi:hypothetical protein